MPKAKSKIQPAGSLRIIAGRWRGRKLAVLDKAGLRPTSDRIRETLFNWLQADIGFAHCLDLYAGTGALGLEAASRGAALVTLVEANSDVAQQLALHCEILQASQCQIQSDTALSFLSKNRQQYNIVFIDPPYQDDAWADIAQQLVSTQSLAKDALIYIEYPRQLTTPELPDSWQLLKEKTAGAVNYALYQQQ